MIIYFNPGLGTVQGVEASLHVNDDVIPIFFKPRPAVEEELSRKENKGIITEQWMLTNWQRH